MNTLHVRKMYVKLKKLEIQPHLTLNCKVKLNIIMITFPISISLHTIIKIYKKSNSEIMNDKIHQDCAC